MKSIAQFLSVFLILCIVPDPKLLPKSFDQQEQNQLIVRNQQVQDTLQQLLDGPRSDIPANNPDFVMRFMAQQTPEEQANNQQLFSLTTVYHDDQLPTVTHNFTSPEYQSSFENEQNYQQSILSRLDDRPGNVDQLNVYIKLATALVYYGYKGYKFLKKDTTINYRLQADVLDIPYKKMVYVYTKAIDKLLQGAENKEDLPEQIKSLILLCRMPIPAWYAKNFQKGLDTLFKVCFDEHGNFTNTANFSDAKFFFKDYLKKAPQSWQDIAKISDWWCKNKKPEPITTKYSQITMTKHNQQLLSIIQADQFTDLVYLKKMVMENGSPIAQKIYEAHCVKFLQGHTNEFGIWQRADFDPLWKNRSQQEKQQNVNNIALNEILMMRDLRVQQLITWLLQKYDKNSFISYKVNDSVITDAFYQALATDQRIFDDHADQDFLRKFFIKCITFLVERKNDFDQSLIFTSQGILKKYEHHPFFLKNDAIYQDDLQKYMNCALVLQSSFFDQQTISLACHVAQYAQAAESCHDEVIKIINRQCAAQIFDIISSIDYQSDSIFDKK